MQSILVAVLALFCLEVVVAAEAPYRPADLEAMREPSPQLLRAALGQARGAMANRRAPVGAESAYYSQGAGTIDGWYSTPGDFLKEPPRTASYLRFTYRGGRLVTIHRHDEKGERLQSFVCYDQRGFPNVAVLQDAKGRPLLVSVLTFDPRDRIKRVLVFNGENQALRMHCFVHHKGYEETESWTFNGMRAWAVEQRTLQRADEVLVFRDDEWQRSELQSPCLLPSLGRDGP